MTKATFYCNGEHLLGFSLVGHTTDYDSEEGRLVCSAVSSAAYLTANTITDFIGNAAEVSVSDGDLRLMLSKPYESSQAVLQGFKAHLEGLSEQYNDYIAVTMEVQHNA